MRGATLESGIFWRHLTEPVHGTLVPAPASTWGRRGCRAQDARRCTCTLATRSPSSVVLPDRPMQCVLTAPRDHRPDQGEERATQDEPGPCGVVVRGESSRDAYHKSCQCERGARVVSLPELRGETARRRATLEGRIEIADPDAQADYLLLLRPANERSAEEATFQS